jgi:hypothetical protein
MKHAKKLPLEPSFSVDADSISLEENSPSSIADQSLG